MNLWIDKELEGTAGTAWNEKAFEAMSDSDCVKLLFFMSVHSFMSIPVCAELEYTRHEAVVVNQDKYMDIVPISIADSLNLGTVLDQCKALEESNAEIGEDGLRIFEEGCPEAIQKKVLRASSKRKALLNKVFSDCFGGNREITVVSGNNLESIMKNIPRDAILCEAAVTCGANGRTPAATEEPLQEETPAAERKAALTGEMDIEPAGTAEELVVDAEEVADTSEKDSAASTRQLVFHIFGERMEGNQSDFMIIAIGRLLKAHPDAIEAATQQFNCLSNVDYENEDVADMPSNFRVCHTAQIAGHQVCIGTSYGLKEKLRLVARIMHFVGENREAVRVEGFELPQIKTKSTDAAQAPTSGRGNEETYTLFGKQYTGNQTQMMWDAFAACFMVLDKISLQRYNLSVSL
ncbi:MAG: hypothetical protein IJ794_02110 [Lachnospiraceae bacterium]|nr:hypothetical protein [Lachnospiraceae bacterium]